MMSTMRHNILSYEVGSAAAVDSFPHPHRERTIISLNKAFERLYYYCALRNNVNKADDLSGLVYENVLA